MSSGSSFRELRALRYAPPGFAGSGGRRTTFQAALDQCEQFLIAAHGADYATRPVQLFYALSQAGRAIVAASPRIGNQSWQVSGHGITASTNVNSVANVTVTAHASGLMPAVSTALGVDCLVPGEPVTQHELWQLLPEAIFAPLTTDSTQPVLLFVAGSEVSHFAQATIAWIPRHVKDLYGDDPAGVKDYLDRYPALREARLSVRRPLGKPAWGKWGQSLKLGVEWRREVELGTETPPLLMPRDRTIDELRVATYRSADDFLITPAIGSMAMGLHPFLALWGVLLALSSLARYEPAAWARMINIDRSAEASAVEYLLDEVLSSLPNVILNLLGSLSQTGDATRARRVGVQRPRPINDER